MTDVWETGWDTLNEACCQLAADLVACNPRLCWRCGHYEKSGSPFYAWAEFSRGDNAGDEDLVISVGFYVNEKRLRFMSDINRDPTGELLVDGLDSEFPLASDTESIRRWVEDCIRRSVAFFGDQRAMLRQELC